AGSATPPAKVEKLEKEKQPSPAAVSTLYERLGREEGLQRTAKMALDDPGAKDLKEKMTPQQLGPILVEASASDRPLNLPSLTAGEFDTLRQVVRGALLDLNIPGADRDELIDRLTKGKR